VPSRKGKKRFNPFYAIDPEFFDFHFFRFSLGETTEEAIRKRKSKGYRTILISNAKNGFNRISLSLILKLKAAPDKHCINFITGKSFGVIVEHPAIMLQVRNHLANSFLSRLRCWGVMPRKDAVY
jgi:hypothetical protein